MTEIFLTLMIVDGERKGELRKPVLTSVKGEILRR